MALIITLTLTQSYSSQDHYSIRHSISYENPDMALHYGAMLRECIRHQSVARSVTLKSVYFLAYVFWYILESQHMKKFFDFIQLPNFDIAADIASTFKEGSCCKDA